MGLSVHNLIFVKDETLKKGGKVRNRNYIKIETHFTPVSLYASDVAPAMDLFPKLSYYCCQEAN